MFQLELKAEPQSQLANVPVLSIREQQQPPTLAPLITCGGISENGFCYCCYLADYQQQSQNQHLIQNQQHHQLQLSSSEMFDAANSILATDGYPPTLSADDDCKSGKQLPVHLQQPQPLLPQLQSQPQQLELQHLPTPHKKQDPQYWRRRARNNQSARKSREKRRHLERHLMEQFTGASCQLYADLLAYSALLLAKQTLNGANADAFSEARTGEIDQVLFYEGICFGLKEAHSSQGLPMRIPLPWRRRSEDLKSWSGRRFLSYVANECLQAPPLVKGGSNGPMSLVPGCEAGREQMTDGEQMFHAEMEFGNAIVGKMP